MKKFLLILCSIFFLLASTGIAAATLHTWIDTKNFGPLFLDNNPYTDDPSSVTYTHNIANDGFSSYLMGGDDIIYSYNLNLGMHDDGDDGWKNWEIAIVNQPGIFGDGIYNFNYSNQDFGWSLAGWAQLNLSGKLTVSVSSWCGDFFLDYSKLSVFGDDGGTPGDIGTVPVPEPASMLLFGTGLIGLAGTFRKSFKK